MIEVEHLLELLLRTPGYDYGHRQLIPTDGPGVYAFFLANGQCSYVGRSRTDRAWGRRVRFHFDSADSGLACQRDGVSSQEAEGIVRTMRAHGLSVAHDDDRLELERLAKSRLRPRYRLD